MISSISIDRRLGAIDTVPIRPIVVRLNDEFSQAVADEFCDAVSRAQETGQPLLPVCINSVGGDLYALLQMATAIRQSKIPVATIVESSAQSSAAMLFALGFDGHRYMAPCANIMFHEVTDSASGTATVLAAGGKSLSQLQRKVFALIAKHLGRPADFLARSIHAAPTGEWWLSAKDAKRLGIATTIGTPALRTVVRVQHEWRVS